MSQVDQSIVEAEKRISEWLLKEATAAEKFVDPDEQFANWLPITTSDKKFFDFAETEQQKIRDLARILSVSDEVCINIIRHYQNHVVGEGISTTILPKDMGNDPTKLAELTEDSKIKKMMENWEAFYKVNNMTVRLRDWECRVHRDGEVFVRLFDARKEYGSVKNVPVIRFIDPFYIKDKGEDAKLGVYVDEDDAEEVKGYNFEVDGKPKKLKPEEIIHDKRNTGIDALRGLSSFWPVFTNIRRISKNVTNVSVLTSILSAIALVRRHTQTTQAKIDAFLSKQSDGRTRTNSVSGKNQYAKHMDAGTVIDAPVGTEYDFPAHTVQSKQYIEVIDKELAMVAMAFVLPVEWLKSAEPATELSHGSPVIKNFQAEQAILFTHIEELFWRVQELMGVNPNVRQKYTVRFFGPTLAVASALDQARVNEIRQRCGVLSPQTWAASERLNWMQERANTIKHRQTAQPGEVMPGDSGNTNVTGDQPSAGQGGDGQTKKDGGTRGSGATKPTKAPTTGNDNE
jgi:hypothetical protein